VYPANEREVVVRMTNERAYPVLVEAWIDHPEGASTTQAPVPFALTPPLFRLDAAKGQTLRIFQSPGAMPTDREVLYYLNVRDIPPKAEHDEDGHLAVAFRSRIKLFHRPAKLAMPPQDAPGALRWHAAGADAVRVHNPTPYFVTVTALESEGGKAQALTGVMVAPFSDLSIPLEAGNTLQAARKFHYTILNDLGGAVRLPGTLGASP
jgi:chaperone protein EcpD